MGQSAHNLIAIPILKRESPDMYRLLRAIGSLLSRYLNQQTLGAYPHPAADLALMSQILKPADVVLVEGKRRISTAIKYLAQIQLVSRSDLRRRVRRKVIDAI
jgi:hypothetical protein